MIVRASAIRLLGLAVVACGPGSSAPADLLLRDVNVVDVVAGEILADRQVAVAGGRILAVEADGRRREAKVTLDAEGDYLLPGLFDLHVHLANDPRSVLPPERQLALHLAHGVVLVRDMGSDPETILALRRRVASGEVAGPRILAAGPFLDGAGEPPLFRAVRSGAEARRAVRDLAASGVDFVKVQARLESAAWSEAVEEAALAGLPVAGHVPDAVSSLEVARRGQRSIEHVSPVLPSDAALLIDCSGDAEGIRAELRAIADGFLAEGADPAPLVARRVAVQERLAGPVDEAACGALVAMLLEHRTAVVPTLVWSRTVAPSPSTDLPGDFPFDLVPPALLDEGVRVRREFFAQAGAERLERNRRMDAAARALVGRLADAGVTILAGTDSFDGFTLPGFSLHQELELLVGSGLSPAAALRAATSVAAAFVGEADDRGAVEAGRVADLLLVRANPLDDIRATRSVETVILAGEVYDRERLDGLLGDSR